MVHALTDRAETLASCESLTAGLFAAEIATVPGASAVLRGGLITYATELKHSLAGVPEETLAAVGPVAEETARAMAEGARSTCEATWGVALTGVAGPDSQDGHPVGEVWIGVARDGGPTLTRRLSIDPQNDPQRTREYIRSTSVAKAIEFLLATLGTIPKR
nr:CinA family protein [Corynebacterium uropygiale]